MTPNRLVLLIGTCALSVLAAGCCQGIVGVAGVFDHGNGELGGVDRRSVGEQLKPQRRFSKGGTDEGERSDAVLVLGHTPALVRRKLCGVAEQEQYGDRGVIDPAKLQWLTRSRPVRGKGPSSWS